MLNPALRVIVVVALVQAVGGCDGPRSPAAPSVPEAGPAAAPPSMLHVFSEPETGFTTTDVRDVQEQVVQFTTANELIWTADGTRIGGFYVLTQPSGSAYFISGNIGCPQGCVFEIRFGTFGGERRAYLTIDYGHDNPGTVVDVEVIGGVLKVTQSNVGPPGTHTLSGKVTEATSAGEVPLEGVLVQRTIAIGSGYQYGVTDEDGVYRIVGLYPGTSPFAAFKDGYHTESRDVSIQGDERLDIRMRR